MKELEGDCGSPSESSRVACVVDFCGPSDFTAIVDANVQAAGPVAKLLGGSLDDLTDEAKAASPVTYVSKDAPPFLIVHGTADKLVPIGQAETLCSALQKAGADVVFVRVEGGSHLLGGPKVMERVAAFFNKHLRGLSVDVSDEPIQAVPAKKETPSARRD